MTKAKRPLLTQSSRARDRYSKPETLLESPDAIVIGSGIGGMSIASILAQKKGWKVLLLEGNRVPGGCTHVHEMDGFEWPSGIDSIGDMDASIGRGINRPTIDYVTGGDLDWAKMPDDHEICHYDDGADEYRWFSSPEKNIEWLGNKFPGEGEKVRRYYGLEAGIERSLWAWVVTKLLPEWIPLAIREGFYKLLGGKWRRYMFEKTAHVFRKTLGMSEKLSALFCYMYGNHGRTPEHSPFAFHAVNLFHYRDGAYYPVGGPGQIPECVVPILEAAGGQLAVDSKVERILVEDNTAVGVELDDGRTVRAPMVISDASAYTTLVELLPPEVSERHGYKENFESLRPSVAHLYLMVGYDEDIDLPRQIFWEIPSYDIDATDARYKEKMDFSGMGTYVLCPSARDPTHSERYPGKSTVVILAEAPYPWIEKARADPEFSDKFRADVEEHLMGVMHRVIPTLKDKKPTVIRAGAPVGCNPWAWEDCSLGLEPSAERFTTHTHWLRPKTRVKNLYLTGQDILSMGFSGAMLGARLCYSAITGNWIHMLKKRLD